MTGELSAGAADEIRRLRWMWRAALLEGGTLILLVCVAVPLKHIAGYPVATSIMGPIHGIAFLLYIWLLSRSSTEGGWQGIETFKLFIMAMIPFGVLFSERNFRSRIEHLSLQS